MSDRTLAIIKPDAVAGNRMGAIIQMIEDKGFRILGLRMITATTAQARAFYAVHSERPFYDSLVGFMTSGPIAVLALQRPDAVSQWRTLMGATDPAKADPGTVRKVHGSSIERNASHGSDSDDNARTEIAFFFRESELV